jgi:hypothetical protein
MTAPVQPKPNFRNMWEDLVDRGISEAEATRHVMRQIANQPDAVRAQYLKDIDPGKLAALGLGAADMMSFGLGDQVARAVETVPIIGAGEGGARMTQEQAFGQHKTAYRVGQGLGLVGPAAAEIGLTKLGRLAPSAARLAVNAVRNKGGRIAAKTALNALEGGAYVGAQAAGHTEGGLGARGKAAVRAAPYGAVAGLALPAAGAALKAVRVPYVSRFFDYLAGEAPAAKPAVRPIPGLLGVGEELGAVTPRPSLVPSRAPAPDLLETPTFLRRETPVPIPLSQRPRPGHPIYTEGPAPTRSAEVRGGEPLLPKANPTIAPVMAKLRQLSPSQLVEAWKNAPQELRDLLLVEFQRRHITVPALGIRPGLLGG